MKITTWNVNSILARAELLQRFLDAERPDVLALQELKTTDDRVPRQLLEDRGYHLLVHGQRQYNGVLLAALRPLSDLATGLPAADEGQARFCAATIEGDDGMPLRFINLYCPQGSTADSDKFAYKLRFYDALLQTLASRPLDRVVVLGDLNIAPEDRDIWDPVAMAGVPSFHPLEHERWRRLIDLGLHDAVRDRVPPRTFSFWDYRGIAFARNEGMRIDHILVGAGLLPLVRAASVGRAWRKKVDGLAASDHAPVFLTLGDPGA